MICGHVLFSQPRFDHVPLSWVPPMTSHGMDGLSETPQNWSVDARLLSVWSMTSGTRESSRLQLLRVAAPSSGRSFELQCDEMSANEPLVRMIPPSEPSKIWVGLFGLTTITCWSG